MILRKYGSLIEGDSSLTEESNCTVATWKLFSGGVENRKLAEETLYFCDKNGWGRGLEL